MKYMPILTQRESVRERMTRSMIDRTSEERGWREMFTEKKREGRKRPSKRTAESPHYRRRGKSKGKKKTWGEFFS